MNHEQIMDTLRRDKYCLVPPGTHKMDGDVLVTSDQWLDGTGKGAVLKFDKAKKHSLIMTKPMRGSLYGSRISSIGVVGGQVQCRDLANHCSFDHVWATDSWGDGFKIDGKGERLSFHNCVAWANEGHGFHEFTPPGVVHNGVAFRHCTSQSNRGAGWRIWTGSQFGTITNTIIDACVSQGNGTMLKGDLDKDGDVDLSDLTKAQELGDLSLVAEVLAAFGSTDITPAEVWISGAVHETTFYNCWFEPTKVKTGVVADAILYGADPAYHPSRLGRPSLTFANNNVISQARKYSIKTTMHNRLVIRGLGIMTPHEQGRLICTSRESQRPAIDYLATVDSTLLCSHDEKPKWIGTFLPQTPPPSDTIGGADKETA